MDPSRGNNEQLERACQQQPDCREVSLKGCKHVTNLSPLYTLRQLWRLNLQGCVNVVDNETLSLISQHNRRLSRLNLCGCEKITDARPLAQLPYLFDLNLSGCNIGNDSLDEIAMHCQQLSRLAINSCPRLTNIAVLLHLKMLKLLYCRYSENISIDSVGSVLVTNGSVLLTLNIDGLRFDQLSIANLPHHSSLNYLNMKDNVVLVSLEWLTKVADRLGELEMLDVEGCEALADIRGVELFPKLKVLRLSRTAVSVEAVLQTVPKCKELTTLSLDGCPHLFTDGDSAVNLAELITPLKHLKKLILPQSLQGTPAVAEIKDRVEVIYVNPPNNNNNNNSTTNNNNNNLTVPNHFHSPGGSAHHSSFTTPTTHKVPQLPSM
ncbi:F-box and leucine-richprotein 14 [Angomonas deanei]|uniref:Leucine Rich repeat n=1 Tax=Angomonas deanei TaxID=59799 RepID=A0A7G2CDA8_9TRYP|nr:F-box and leucine-richprotein 14 [Angomonas deanei]CAD2216927.1 hypothetical protein, conserved [Angomonas deanei]|eukprot:EPY18500.1 F-box and leucine-richprotein 14 [Angomonas deanei]